MAGEGFERQVLRELDQIQKNVKEFTDKLTDSRLEVAKIVETLKGTFVTKEEHRAIARLVWLMVTIFVGVAVSVIGLVINGGVRH